jgi:DNA-binding transcriptional ArsR family regulator
MKPKQLGQFTKALVRGAPIDRLVKATGLTRQTISTQLKAMREVGAVHIKRWDRDSSGCRSRAVWALGNKEDAARPSMTPAQRQKAYRVRQATKVEAAQ